MRPAGAAGTGGAAAPRAEGRPDSWLASSSTGTRVADEAGRRGVLAGGASPGLPMPGRGARRLSLSGAQGHARLGGGWGGSAGVPAWTPSGCPFLAADWERLEGTSASQHYFLTRGGEVGWRVEKTGEGAAGGATAPEPWGEGPGARGGPSPASPTSRGESGSVAPRKAEPSRAFSASAQGAGARTGSRSAALPLSPPSSPKTKRSWPGPAGPGGLSRRLRKLQDPRSRRRAHGGRVLKD